jgi:hypothetical protein
MTVVLIYWQAAVSALLNYLYLLTYMAWAQPKHPAVKRLEASTAHGGIW